MSYNQKRLGIYSNIDQNNIEQVLGINQALHLFGCYSNMQMSNDHLQNIF